MAGDTPNQHDMLTGSQMNGTAYTATAWITCNNWTSSSTGGAQVAIRIAWGWPIRKRPDRGTALTEQRMQPENLVGTGGPNLFYCFAN